MPNIVADIILIKLDADQMRASDGSAPRVCKSRARAFQGWSVVAVADTHTHQRQCHHLFMLINLYPVHAKRSVASIERMRPSDAR